MNTRQIVIQEMIDEWTEQRKDIDLSIDNVKENCDKFTQRLFALQREEEYRINEELENRAQEEAERLAELKRRVA